MDSPVTQTADQSVAAAPVAPVPLPPPPEQAAGGASRSLPRIVHDLRNPLSAFTTALHLLNAQSDEPELVRRLAGMMQQQLDRLTRVVDELSKYSAEQSQSERRQSVSVESVAPLPRWKILLVDDNQSATHMMSRLLEKLGQEVHVAYSAAEALEQVPTFAPDFVISDIAMPGMSGYDLARRIRELNPAKRPFLVAVTGYGLESDRQEALAAGFDKHLTKPLGVAGLESLLRSGRQ